MFNKLPKKVIEYLINELPPFTGVLIIRSDNNGIILDHHGPHSEYLHIEPVKGKAIHEYVPALFSIIPPLVSPMVLNNIKSNTKATADIHIVEDNENKFWIFFVDQSHQVEGIRDILQKINETKLLIESNSEIAASVDPYEVFEDLILLIKDDETAIINSKIPGWFESYSPNYSISSKIKFTEVFPYLEVFLFEAKEFWLSQKTGKIESGIWSETISEGMEMAFTAYAIYNNGSKFLLVRPMEQEVDKEQMALQMAREQVLAYEKLEKTEKKLNILLDYKDKFVSIVSHDLRSPVAAVLGITELLVNDDAEISKLSDFYQEMILSIREEMIRLLDYNDKLYHWSNLELGNFKIVKEKVNLKKIIETTERTAKNKTESKNISFSTNLVDDIIIDVDVSLFQQALNNLLSNAIKFTPVDGTIFIKVQSGDNINISIVDSGVGIPKEISENIFSGFTRKSTLGTHGEKGTGLGLGIVKKILDAHGFTIDVESDIGKGSKFIITIPKILNSD